MPNTDGVSLGFTTSISAAGMARPAVITSRDNGAPIRSITVGNQTSSTTAVIYLSSSPQGQPVLAVVPGQYATIPVQETTAVSVRFVVQAGQAFDGAIFLHVDPTPLAASGFTASNTAPLWVWDTSTWDGTSVWST